LYYYYSGLATGGDLRGEERAKQNNKANKNKTREEESSSANRQE